MLQFLALESSSTFSPHRSQIAPVRDFSQQNHYDHQALPGRQPTCPHLPRADLPLPSRGRGLSRGCGGSAPLPLHGDPWPHTPSPPKTLSPDKYARTLAETVDVRSSVLRYNSRTDPLSNQADVYITLCQIRRPPLFVTNHLQGCDIILIRAETSALHLFLRGGEQDGSTKTPTSTKFTAPE